MAKWRLFLTVLPFTLLFALAKLAMHQLGWEPWALIPSPGPCLAPPPS